MRYEMVDMSEFVRRMDEGSFNGELITLVSILRIPVCMQSVPLERIFRPRVWSSFVDSDSLGADYRACKNFGPIYGR